jgi:hypothetical protein
MKREKCSSFSLSFCPFSVVVVLSVLLFTASDYLFGIFKPLFVLCHFHFVIVLMTKEKGQREKEKLEGTKEVIRSRK